MATFANLQEELNGRAVDWFDNPDPVMLTHPRLDHLVTTCVSPPAVGLPNGFTGCSWSAFFLTFRLVRGISPSQLLSVRNVATIPQMLAHLTAHGLGNFPVFVHTGVGTVCAHVSGQRRTDGWHLLFVPSEPGFPQAHWAFVRGFPCEPSCNPGDLGGVVYTGHLPPSHPDVFWRAPQLPELGHLVAARQAMNPPCACFCVGDCEHLSAWHATHPNSLVASFGLARSGDFLMQIVGSNLVGTCLRKRGVDCVYVDPTSGVRVVQTDCYDVLSTLFRVGVTHSRVSFGTFVADLYQITPHSFSELSVVPSLLGVLPSVVKGACSRLLAPSLGVADVATDAVASVPSRLTTLFERFVRFLLRIQVRVPERWRPLPPPNRAEWLWQQILNSMTPYRMQLMALGVMGVLSLHVARLAHRNSFPRRFRPVHLHRDYTANDLETLQLPAREQLERRIAVKGKLTEAWVRDLLHRLAHEENWAGSLNKDEVDTWVSRVLEMHGEAVLVPVIPVGHCASCGVKANLFHLECRECRTNRRSALSQVYFVPPDVCRVPILGINSRHPKVPHKPFRADSRVPPQKRTLPRFAHISNQDWADADTMQWICKLKFRGIRVTSVEQAERLYAVVRRPLVCSGRLCGPMLCGEVIECYPNGPEAAIMAFAGRLAPATLVVDTRAVTTLMVSMLHWCFQRLDGTAHSVIPWTEQQVLDHQRVPAKRRLLEQCYAEIARGDQMPLSRLLSFSYLVKQEKSVRFEYCEDYLLTKEKQLPRFICAPPPQTNALLAPYTLAVMKGLGRLFSVDAPITYMGGTTPSEQNAWLNSAIGDGANPTRWVFEADIESCDASIGAQFQDFLLYTLDYFLEMPMPAFIRNLFTELRYVRIQRNGLTAEVGPINASGVPHTSLATSANVAIANLVSIACGMLQDQIHSWPLDELSRVLCRVVATSRLANAGDDVINYVASSIPHPSGRLVTINEHRFKEHYSRSMEWFGLIVRANKCRMFPPNQFRLATFLAMRPHWSGDRYEWGPEIARRMKAAYWQFDGSHHPTAWARGISVALLKVGRHVPVLNAIADWHLHITKGPTLSIPWTNPWSVFAQYEVQGNCTERTIREFCIDYDIEPSQLQSFSDLLGSISTPFVNLDHCVLRAVFRRE